MITLIEGEMGSGRTTTLLRVLIEYCHRPHDGKIILVSRGIISFPSELSPDSCIVISEPYGQEWREMILSNLKLRRGSLYALFIDDGHFYLDSRLPWNSKGMIEACENILGFSGDVYITVLKGYTIQKRIRDKGDRIWKCSVDKAKGRVRVEYPTTMTSYFDVFRSVG